MGATPEDNFKVTRPPNCEAYADPTYSIERPAMFRVENKRSDNPQAKHSPITMSMLRPAAARALVAVSSVLCGAGCSQITDDPPSAPALTSTAKSATNEDTPPITSPAPATPESAAASTSPNSPAPGTPKASPHVPAPSATDITPSAAAIPSKFLGMWVSIGQGSAETIYRFNSDASYDKASVLMDELPSGVFSFTVSETGMVSLSGSVLTMVPVEGTESLSDPSSPSSNYERPLRDLTPRTFSWAFRSEQLVLTNQYGSVAYSQQPNGD